MEKENTDIQTLQPLRPDPALRKLDVLVGKWNLRGRTLDTAEDNITGWVNFEWLPGGFFLQANGEIDFMATSSPEVGGPWKVLREVQKAPMMRS